MKKKIVIVMVALGVIGAGLYGGAYLIYQTKVKNIELTHPSLKDVADGQYTGGVNAIFVQATVKVDVKDRQITTIELVKHVKDRGEKGEAVVAEVLAAQSTDVDTVSGATNSSRVILKSIENALEKGVD